MKKDLVNREGTSILWENCSAGHLLCGLKGKQIGMVERCFPLNKVWLLRLFSFYRVKCVLESHRLNTNSCFLQFCSRNLHLCILGVGSSGQPKQFHVQKADLRKKKQALISLKWALVDVTTSFSTWEKNRGQHMFPSSTSKLRCVCGPLASASEAGKMQQV